MAKFKVIVSDPEKGTSKSIEVVDNKAIPLIGRKINDIIDGTLLGLAGNKIIITGGTDKDGFPMRPDVHGGVKKKILLSGGIGFKSKRKGHRRRKTVRGNIITEDIVQINAKILEKSKKTKKS